MVAMLPHIITLVILVYISSFYKHRARLDTVNQPAPWAPSYPFTSTIIYFFNVSILPVFILVLLLIDADYHQSQRFEADIET